MSDVNKNLGHATAYGYAKSKGYTGTEDEFATLMASYADVAEQARESAEDSEAWAVGERDGVPVPETDAQYHNNSKYYAEQADTSAGQSSDSAEASGASALVSEGHATGTQDGEPVEEGSPYYHNNALYYSQMSSQSADDADGYKRDAETAKTNAKTAEGNAEAWAVGTKDSAPVTQSDPQYQNNAKYYAEQAQDAADASAAMTGLADQFDSTTAYAIGDYVLYDGTLYQFTASHPAGAWTGTDAVAVTLAPEVSDLKTQISISTKKVINPELFTPPINVYRSISGYECDLPYTDISDFVKIYVDSVNGDDANDGTSLNAPIKTLYRAEYLMRKKAQTSNSVEIIIKNGSVFYYDDIPANWDVKYSMVLRAEGHAKIFAGKKGAWTASSNHYVSETFSDVNIIGCVDTTDTDEYGLYNPMQFLSSESDVENTLNSYYIDTTNKVAYVHPKAGADVNDIVVLFSNKYAAQISARLAESDMFIYMQGIDFVGNSTAKGKSNASLSDAIKRTIYFENCSFQHGCSNNVISINDFRYAYLVGCVGGYGKLDVWNYHFTLQSDPANSVVVEVDCAGKEGGYYNGISGTSDQISTCHDGANILRCNTHGYNSDGSLIADVNGCYTVCLDCTLINTSYVGASGASYAPYRFDNAQAMRSGKTVLQNCFGYDSRNTKFVTAVDLTLNGVNGTGSISAEKLTVGRHMI